MAFRAAGAVGDAIQAMLAPIAFREVLLFAGAGLIGYGLSLVYPAAGFVAPGIILAYVAIFGVN